MDQKKPKGVDARDETLDPPAVESPVKPPPHQESEGEQGKEEGEHEVKSPTAAGAAAEETGLQKKFRRAERFGVAVVMSEEEKRSSRAERFGTISSSSETAGGKVEEQKRKARAERFGLAAPPVDDQEAKKKARLARFADNSKVDTAKVDAAKVDTAKVDTAEEEKRKARAARFSEKSSASSEANGKSNSELSNVLAKTKTAA